VDLPLYVSEAEREAHAVRHGVPHVAPAWFRASTRAAETVVHEIGRRAPTLDRLVLPSSFESGPILVISRLVLLRPHDAATTFDGWRPTVDCVASAGGGQLALGAALEGLRPPRLRALVARLVLPRSAVTLPVELELMTWDAFHTILSLRLRGRVRRMVSRRPRYFAAGHAALDDIRDELEGRAAAERVRSE
jgi:hypothetical protein